MTHAIPPIGERRLAAALLPWSDTQAANLQAEDRAAEVSDTALASAEAASEEQLAQALAERADPAAAASAEYAAAMPEAHLLEIAGHWWLQAAALAPQLAACDRGSATAADAETLRMRQLIDEARALAESDRRLRPLRRPMAITALWIAVAVSYAALGTALVLVPGLRRPEAAGHTAWPAAAVVAALSLLALSLEWRLRRRRPRARLLRVQRRG